MPLLAWKSGSVRAPAITIRIWPRALDSFHLVGIRMSHVWYSNAMRIGIVGARLAGSYAALILSRLRHEVLLLDPAAAGEKACGGGITGKALLRIPWFREQELPYSEIKAIEMTTLEGRSATLPLSHPIRIFSRAALDEALRNAAIQAGAQFRPERALRFTPCKDGWSIATSRGACYRVDFLVGADGANSAVRAAVAGKFAADDLSIALGHYLPGVHHPDRVVVVFQEHGFHGYLWSFPRVDHASIGIIHPLPNARAADLRRRVGGFISDRYPYAAGSEIGFFAARVPSLRRSTLVNQRVCGRNWALLGDAAGFVDAITSEGIYFALRSAEVLGSSIRDGNPLIYEQRWRHDFGVHLERAAAWRDRFYAGTLFKHAFTRRALQMIQGSATVRRLTDGLICGLHTYEHLRSSLLSHSPKILAEALRTVVFGQAS